MTTAMTLPNISDAWDALADMPAGTAVCDPDGCLLAYAAEGSAPPPRDPRVTVGWEGRA